ncbi:hypothetical protein PTSG_08032 [Salpingoeca rosetta]|uniref:Fibronectin type-III domain-containing protein n=1 Tax=Salpingoeca rosetta (strain ATCC 50818 / BSB-021) TaxID=946362 RepID=F2UHT2_SALR5|nr:uncharacterized protein PTSG_08032 [Salpingoeca rosetta]EGD76681.1 hypothetical protein PTSG_08032 [Salpingoeca rosetta]|eukprot:XP_004991053.1 hypothetical protein PTSG_08032 [Salpingoeca rosetta]
MRLLKAFAGCFGAALLLLGAVVSQQLALTAALPAAPINANHVRTSCPPMCRPSISANSTIVPVPGDRAAVALLPWFGDCDPTLTTFSFHISWSESSTTSGTLPFLKQVHELHQYAESATYTIDASYCYSPKEGCEMCSTLSKVITVS